MTINKSRQVMQRLPFTTRTSFFVTITVALITITEKGRGTPTRKGKLQKKEAGDTDVPNRLFD
jgi:hypothetical protein